MPIREAISSLYLSLERHFDQINFIPSELISLISLTGNNSSSINATQSTLTIAGFAGLHQIGICSSYHHVIDIISDWVANALQVYKTSNQFIPLKLRGKTFTVFEKDSKDKISKSNEATKYFHGTSLCAFQSMKPVDDGIARRYSHKDLVGTVGDFSLPQSYTNAPPLLKKYKKYSCALPTVNIPEYI